MLGATSRPELSCRQAALKESARGVESSWSFGVKLAGAVKRVEIVAAADVLAVDEDLRHAGAAARALHQLLALGAVLYVDVEVDVLWTLSVLQQALRPGAIGAEQSAW